MKSGKSAPNAPEYAQLLNEFDKAQSAYTQAKVKEVSAKHQLKAESKKDLSKIEAGVLKHKLNHAKHVRKAQKAGVEIAKLAIKKWLKSNPVNTAETAVAEAPKRRGPKPKSEETAPIQTVVDAVPKKRGRQAKAEEAVAQVVEATEAPASKKRGRQAKAQEAEGVGKKVEVAQQTIVEAAEVPAPKKRGRQAKAAPETVEAPGEEEEGVAGASAREMEAAEPAAKTKGVKEAKAPKATKEEPDAATPAEKRPRRSSEDVVAQKEAAEAAVKAALKGDDFRILEGIGPKVTTILHDNGILAFQDLATSTYETLKALMLSNRQYLANPTNWARQASLAAEGKMAELEAFKTELKNAK